MSQYRADALSIPKAWADAVKRWRGPAFKLAMSRARENLSGRMMKRITGATLGNVERNSRVETFGFKLETRLRSLIAWMTGVRRKGFFVQPKGIKKTFTAQRVGSGFRRTFTTKGRGAKALRFMVNGKVVFSKGHFIPPWTFRPVRPVLHEAVEHTHRDVVELFKKEADTALREMFPSLTFNVEISF